VASDSAVPSDSAARQGPTAASDGGTTSGGRPSHSAPDRRAPIVHGTGGQPLPAWYDVGLLDLDGVVYLGAEPIRSAAPALDAARAAGLTLAYVTNNASRTPEEVADLLSGMGVPAGADDVVTSSQAAAHLLRDRLGPTGSVLVVGAPALADAVREQGLRIVASADDRPDAVVQGFARTVGWTELAEAAVALRRGALWVGTNADSTLPSDRGPLPGNGSLLAVLRTATGQEPLVVGKPEVQLHNDAVERTGARRPLVVGDRLDTDILGATNGGADSLLVLTGISQPQDVLRATADRRPTLLGADLSSLRAVHPPVSVADGAVLCGVFRVDIDTEAFGLSQTGDGDSVDALRALCVAAWRRSDAETSRRRGTGQSGGDGADTGQPPDLPRIQASGDCAALLRQWALGD